MRSRRILGPIVVVAVVLALAGCDMVRFGAKCRVGAPVGRDATHVLYCKNGKWARLVTIGQAAQIIIGNLPGKIAVQTPSPIVATVGGGTFGLEVKVTKRNGGDSAGTSVEVTGPGTGASITGPVTATTDASGVARPVLTTNGALGTYELTVKVNGAESVTVPVRNGPTINVVSGNSAPLAVDVSTTLVLQVTDAKGNAIVGLPVTFGTVDLTATAATTNASGIVSPTVFGAGKVGTRVLKVTTGGTTIDVPFTIIATKATRLDIVTNAPSLAAPRSATYPIPLTVEAGDRFNNVIPNVTVTYTVVNQVGGANATLSASSDITDAVGVAGRNIKFTTNGTPGSFQIVATAPNLVTATWNVVNV